MKAKKKRPKSFDLSLPSSFHQEFINDFLSTLGKESFAEIYLRSELLSKLGTEAVSPDERQSRAINKWLETDWRNGRTNARLGGGCFFTAAISSDDVIDRARGTIRRIIGEVPPKDILYGIFSNGASTRIRRGPTAIPQKYEGKAHVTRDAWPWILPILVSCTTWSTINPEIFYPEFVRGNVLFTVPKNSEIDRVACKEPEINMLAQKGVGDFIRKRLQRSGIDLDDQTRNQRLALIASSSGILSTIDLSSASDSISYMLVARLLPTEWFRLLDAIRSKETLIAEEWYEPNMFSSMGNGFTFELESLLFYSLARAIAYYSRTPGTISVYGDDIIVPVSVAPRLARWFRWFGFLVNTKKSHWSGPFRESCGKHYYRGCDVTPFYVRRRLDHVTRIIHFLNHLRKWLDNAYSPELAQWWANKCKLVPRLLWGGQDLDSISALVTGHKPRMRLVQVMKRVRCPADGAYLHWLRLSDGRVGLITEPLVTSEATVDLPSWKVRRNLDRTVYGTSLTYSYLDQVLFENCS